MKKILMTLALAPVMAMALEKNPDCTSADVAKLREQADAGDAEAQSVVGHCYENGLGVETNRAEALKWYRKAAEQGRTTAQYRLWIGLATGDGVEKDAKEAMKWYCELVRKNYQSLSGSASEWKAEMQRIGLSRPRRTLAELASLHQKQLDSLVAMGEEVKSKPPEVQTRYHTDLKVEKKVLDFLKKKNSTSCTCQNNAKCNKRNQFSRAKSKQLQETVGDYTWSYHVVNGEALIISDKRCCAVSPNPKGHVTIPTALGGAKVTGIGSSAFACSEITSVEIPSGVNQIGSCAFMGCSELGSMALPEGLTDIGRQAFAGCEKLKSITLPASVKSIGGGVFEWCRKLSEIKVAEGNQNFAIVGGVLYTKDLSELVMCPNTRTSVKIPSGVRNIGLSSFEGCEVLDSITIPEGMTNIGWSAFRYCRKLKTATIPASMVSIDEGVFSSCEALKEILVESGNRNFTSVDGVLYTKDRAELVMCPNALTSAVILPEVKTVRPYAFSGCAGLTSITIPNGVTNIRHGAFSDCNGLKSVVIPPSVAKLGQQAFSRCAELESVTFLGERPDSLKNDFGGSAKLRAIHVPANAKSWAGMKEWQGIPLVFDGQPLDPQKEKELPEAVQQESARQENVIAERLAKCSYLLNGEFKRKAKVYICLFATTDCGVCRSEMQRIANAYADNLKDDPDIEVVEFSLDRYEKRALDWAKAHDIKFPITNPTSFKNVESIDLPVFSFPHLFIVRADGVILEDGHPASTFTVAKLRDLKSGRLMPSARNPDIKDGPNEAVVDGHTWSFTVQNGEAKIELRRPKMLGGLCAVSPSPVGDITIPSVLGGVKVTGIGRSAFKGCGELKSVTIPPSIWDIDGWPFHGCNKLESVTIQSDVIRISEGCLSCCAGLKQINVGSDNRVYASLDGLLYTKDMDELVQCPAGLTSVDIQKDVTSIGNYSFCGCRQLTVVTLPPHTKSIGVCAFRQCTGLKAITIPSDVRYIGGGAFAECEGLTTVVMQGECPSSPNEVFENCANLKSIHVPASSKSWAGMKEWQGIPLVFDAELQK